MFTARYALNIQGTRIIERLITPYDTQFSGTHTAISVFLHMQLSFKVPLPP